MELPRARVAVKWIVKGKLVANLREGPREREPERRGQGAARPRREGSGPMRFCGRLAAWGDAYTKATQGYWKDTTTASGNDLGWHKDRYFLGKLAHASFYSTAMSQSQVQFLYQSYLDHDYTPDSARAVTLGSLAALAAGLAALLL